MNSRGILLVLTLGVASLRGQNEPVDLPQVFVVSPRIANQAPVGTFVMPVSSLRFEPAVDIQARNLTEGQADLTIRGGIFENTGVVLGVVSPSDPQTGHYFAEIPVPATMLQAPVVLTGADHALQTTNSTVGGISYGWRPIRTGGAVSVGAGDHELNRQEFQTGYSQSVGGDQNLGAEVSWARSESEGALPFGDHHFDRIGGRFQLRSKNSQTDLYAGYQKKFFGWRNLYTPFNSLESENLETTFFALNHRTNFGGGDYVEAGAFHRRNKDDYAFNRLAPLTAVHPFQHTTWLDGVAVAGRASSGDVAVTARGEFSTDFLKSTSLTAGNYHTRSLAKFTVLPEKTWTGADKSQWVFKAGGSIDGSNRSGTQGSPIVSIANEHREGAISSLSLSYAQTTQLPSYTALNSSAASGLFRGNPNLGRETSRNLEFSLHSTLAGWALQGAAFYRQDRSLVDWTFRKGVTARAANAVDIDTTGAEIFARRSWAAFDFTLGYTVLAKDADYRGATVDASFYALNYARQRVTAAIAWRVNREFEFRMDNAARVQADNVLRSVGGDETLISSLGVFWHPAALRGVEISAQADNLWNSNFQEVPSVPAARRQLALGVSYAW